MLKNNFKSADFNLTASYKWARDPFQNILSIREEEICIDSTASDEIKRQFRNKSPFKFSIELNDEFSAIKTRIFPIL